MISEKQKKEVIELFLQGVPKVTIAKKKDMSRTKVGEIIKDYESSNVDLSKKEPGQEDVDSDPEIIKLKKELTKEQLKRKIREQTQPFEVEKALNKIEEFKGDVYRYVNRIFSNALLGKGLKHFKCSNCDEEGYVAMKIKCTSCDEEIWYGWHP